MTIYCLLSQRIITFVLLIQRIIIHNCRNYIHIVCIYTYIYIYRYVYIHKNDHGFKTSSIEENARDVSCSVISATSVINRGKRQGRDSPAAVERMCLFEFLCGLIIL